MKKSIAVVLICLTCMIPAFSNGQKESAAKSYVFASDCTWPPLEFVDEHGEIVGFEIDLIKEFSAMTGIPMTSRNVAWDGIFAGLTNGMYDAVASGVSVTEERKATMDFSTPILLVTQSILSMSGETDQASIEDLAGKRVGVQIGTTGNFALEARTDLAIQVKAYDEIPLAVEDLINGTLDAVVCDSLIASDFVLSNEHYKGKLEVTGTASSDIEEIAMCVKKGNTELLTIINDCIAKLQANGKMDELKAKWNLI
ncbi:MAG: basic amino acid ABC transporter substrate-binding protein [Sphaerochaetaceae bacterium]